MKLPRTLLLAAAIAVPAAAFADGSTTVAATETAAPTTETAQPDPTEPLLIPELGESPIEPVATETEPAIVQPDLIGELPDHDWDDCPGCGMG